MVNPWYPNRIIALQGDGTREQIVVAATRLLYGEAIRAVPPDSHPKTWVVRRSMGTRYGP